MLYKKSLHCWNKKVDIKTFIIYYEISDFNVFLTVDVQYHRFLHCIVVNTVKLWCCIKNPDSAETKKHPGHKSWQSTWNH